MANDTAPKKGGGQSEFEREATQAQAGIVAEFVDYLRQNKKWWITPIVIVLLMVGALVVFGGSAAAPFIYTLF
ncbi:MAG: DUF5989 family protein [Actinobacteria bacterium]|nr:DUF5989 family protein [Actinomycetota bacterium]